MTTVYNIDKQNNQVLSSGPVPAVWGTISGMSDLSEQDLADLTWAGYPNYGFLTREAALARGITVSQLDQADYLYKKLTVPEKVSILQMRLALLKANLLASVETSIANIQDATERATAQIEWQYAQEIPRNNFLANLLKTSLNLSEDQIDDLFIAAGKL